MHFFERLLDTFAAAAALFTPDGAYDDGFFGVHRGRAAIAAMLARFHEGGEAFRWQFTEPLANLQLGYARYCFSYVSKQTESRGQPIVFEGMSRFRFAGELIADYAEVFDRGVAFVQLGYAEARIVKLLGRYAGAWRADERVHEHLAWRERQSA
jgi:hypothetical protein